MRFLIIIRGYGLLLIVIFFIGLTHSPDLNPQELTPQTAKEFVRRGELYAEQGEYEKALADYNTAEQLRPRDRLAIYYSIYRNQAEALTALNRPAEAIENYQKIKQKRQVDERNTTDVDRQIAELQTKMK